MASLLASCLGAADLVDFVLLEEEREEGFRPREDDERVLDLEVPVLLLLELLLRRDPVLFLVCSSFTDDSFLVQARVADTFNAELPYGR